MDDFPELIFGLIGAIGTDLDAVYESLKEQLERVGYTPIYIKLSGLMTELETPPWSNLPPRSAVNYYERAMSAGDKLCQKLDRGDAMAALAINAITVQRKLPDFAEKRRAYVLSSLKRPDEVNLLRRIYGPYFFAISAYAPRSARVDRLARKLAENRHRNKPEALRSQAEELIVRDEKDQKAVYGQDVRKTFPQADLFVKASPIQELNDATRRFIELLFGHLWHTPTQDEQGMALAHLARVRSASPARQVGAALTRADGQVISIGTNEVACSGGGQYWGGDEGDGRDYAYDDSDLSDLMRRNLLIDLLERLKGLKFLANSTDVEGILTGEKDISTVPALRSAQLFDTIDFIRSVHAEAAAILAAPSLSELRNSTLYVTTFPCHECARHIVMAGVKRVVYVEPYPKSLVSVLYRDSISVDPVDECGKKVSFNPFVGIAPSLYAALFEASSKTRKDENGAISKWNPSRSFPHHFPAYSYHISRVAETNELEFFNEKLASIGAVPKGKTSKLLERKNGSNPRKRLVKKGSK